VANNIVVSTGAADILPTTIEQFQATAFSAIDAARSNLEGVYRGTPGYGGSVEIKSRDIVRPPDRSSAAVSTPSVVYTSPVGYSCTWSFEPLAFGNPPDHVSIDDVSMRSVNIDTSNVPLAPTIAIPDRDPDVYPDALEVLPTAAAIVIPEPPTLAAVPAPTFEPVNLPDAPVVVIPEFAVPRPTSGAIAAPADDFLFAAQEYSSDLLTKTVSKVKEFLAGGVGIADHIWEQIWAREGDKENREATKLIGEVDTTWSKRRFTMPQGFQAAQIRHIHQDVRSSSATRAREVATQEAQLDIENLKFAVEQGVALESIRGNFFFQTQSHALDAAKFGYQISVEIYNAKLALFSAEVQMYVADVTAYKAQIEGALATLELYKSELEGQAIINQVNQTTLSIYLGYLEAAKTDILFFEAHITKANAEIEVTKMQFDEYRLAIDKFGAELQETSTHFDAYKLDLAKPEMQAKIYETNTSAFSALMQAKATDVDAASTEAQIKIDNNKLKIQQFTTELESYNASINAQVSQLDANTKATNTKIDHLNALLVDAKNASDMMAEVYAQDVKIQIQKSNEGLERARIEMEKMIFETQRVQELSRAAVEVEAGFAAASMSAVNLSTSMNDSASNSASA